MDNFQDLIKLSKKLFYFGISLQTLAIGIVTFIIVMANYYKSINYKENAIIDEYKQQEASIAHSIFVLETIKNSAEIMTDEVPQIKTMHENLKLRGIETILKVSNCTNSQLIVSSDNVFSFNTGTRNLNSCLFIKITNAVDTSAIKTIFLSIAISILIMSLLWLMLKNQFTELLIKPLAQRLTQKNRDIVAGSVARKVAHDIRSPLTALLVAVNKFHEAPDDSLALLKSASKRIEEIANQLLKTTKLGNIDLPLGVSSDSNFTSDCDLFSIIKEIINEKQFEFSAYKHITFRNLIYENKRESLSQFNFDIKQILSNVINNSVEATRGDNINIITVDADVSCGATMITVTDAGEGMSEDILAKLNSNIDTEFTTKVSGGGLGLSTAKRTLLSNGGRLKVLSKEGIGTIVQIILPGKTVTPI